VRFQVPESSPNSLDQGASGSQAPGVNPEHHPGEDAVPRVRRQPLNQAEREVERMETHRRDGSLMKA
jgi:hypothetical protein